MEIAKPGIDLGVFVKDIEGCLRFYCDGLGLQKVGEVPLGPGRTMHRLQIGDSVLKLNHYAENAPEAGPRGFAKRLGLGYFTIAVRDLPGVVKELEGKGMTFTVPLREFRPGVHICMLEDPDGNTVELLGA